MKLLRVIAVGLLMGVAGAMVAVAETRTAAATTAAATIN